MLIHTIKNIFNLVIGLSWLLSGSDPTVGLSNIVTSYSEGTARCSFTRQNNLVNVVNYFDSNQSYYVLAANGSLHFSFLSLFFKSFVNYSISYHGKNRWVSPSMIYFGLNSTNTRNFSTAAYSSSLTNNASQITTNTSTSTRTLNTSTKLWTSASISTLISAKTDTSTATSTIIVTYTTLKKTTIINSSKTSKADSTTTKPSRNPTLSSSASTKQYTTLTTSKINYSTSNSTNKKTNLPTKTITSTKSSRKTSTVSKLTTKSTITSTKPSLKSSTFNITPSISPISTSTKSTSTTIAGSSISIGPTSTQIKKTTKSNLIIGDYEASEVSLSWIGDSISTNFSMSNTNMNKGNYFAFAFSIDNQMVSQLNIIIIINNFSFF